MNKQPPMVESTFSFPLSEYKDYMARLHHIYPCDFYGNFYIVILDFEVRRENHCRHTIQNVAKYLKDNRQEIRKEAGQPAESITIKLTVQAEPHDSLSSIMSRVPKLKTPKDTGNIELGRGDRQIERITQILNRSIEHERQYRRDYTEPAQRKGLGVKSAPYINCTDLDTIFKSICKSDYDYYFPCANGFFVRKDDVMCYITTSYLFRTLPNIGYDPIKGFIFYGIPRYAPYDEAFKNWKAKKYEGHLIDYVDIQKMWDESIPKKVVRTSKKKPIKAKAMEVEEEHGDQGDQGDREESVSVGSVKHKRRESRESRESVDDEGMTDVKKTAKSQSRSRSRSQSPASSRESSKEVPDPKSRTDSRSKSKSIPRSKSKSKSKLKSKTTDSSKPKAKTKANINKSQFSTVDVSSLDIDKKSKLNRSNTTITTTAATAAASKRRHDKSAGKEKRVNDRKDSQKHKRAEKDAERELEKNKKKSIPRSKPKSKSRPRPKQKSKPKSKKDNTEQDDKEVHSRSRSRSRSHSRSGSNMEEDDKEDNEEKEKNQDKNHKEEVASDNRDGDHDDAEDQHSSEEKEREKEDNKTDSRNPSPEPQSQSQSQKKDKMRKKSLETPEGERKSLRGTTISTEPASDTHTLPSPIDEKEPVEQTAEKKIKAA